MQMKYVSLSACFGMALLSIPAIASDTGTITFTGSIVGTTCNVNIGGSGENADVSLRSGNATALVAPGSTDGDTRFSLQLSGCAGGAPEATAAKAFFQPGSTVTADGRLMNTAVTDAASNVTLQLLDGQDNSVINIGDYSQTTHSAGYVNISDALSSGNDGTVELPYYVRYHSEGGVTAGAVTSQVTYAITYQ
ncbi:type 1 fimbrial protein [Klebsiella oxytoca]|uniref:fimbrial protein n=1 Tax=Enterobacteriaceae TaxID=543 RepID=UPI00115B4E18|nr:MULTISPECIES: fimbrial protein [Enterobacteriaceae]HBT4779385.1 type 1 fimbrial protein [Klebsiella pneumoniae]HCQ8236487.1 type 1 fimbrial protein [Klebsiella michiganensis]EIZ1086428.1 type 1 fimbrial protein [Klebsiella oxytoca]MBZ7264437.1 type 1 fimbrial protein [Klebsiella oxytoca]MCE5369300.1 type 1 fimbrial protein [Klebsiella oxytoca]